MTNPIYVAVVGPADATEAEVATAEQVGSLLAGQGAIVVCGGLGGVMEAVSKGASARGGVTIGLLPGSDRSTGNQHLSVALPTGLGEMRNGLVVRVCDALIAIGGSWGTLSEIALAMRTGKPTVVVNGWEVHDPRDPEASELRRVASPEEAVKAMLSLIAAGKNPDAR
jgi:uncharacterized protein (TIGR00725 family)